MSVSDIFIYFLTSKAIVVTKRSLPYEEVYGRVAQLGERHVYTVDVTGSSPVPPTILFLRGRS